ncbi:S8 family serine peptidase [Shewanella dokdonensis]|uniref:S8 family serine peptidase n=1 Tax=Shewanella dokdonensis TaxID=712036 RepID=A0ABX8DE80_9GAMM|nr:S8 family serine peptidase [Shewanella dokdonensis]MCL1073499.1 S8 family serine peptidase [Shewanella dokdonensis]QVK22715.1 S8 family serine peptidase [Shewanella dokdonensis]
MRSLYQAVAAAILLALGTTAVMANERYIVKFKDGKGPAVKAALHAQGAKLELELTRHNAAAFSLPAQALTGLSHNPNVEYVELDAKRYPMSQTVPYGIPLVQANQVSDAMTGDMKVCIIDSGYDLAHEDLSGNRVDGANDSGTGNWFTDENHHGTHVAGTIAALNNDVGVIGVNPNGNLNLFIVKVFNADGWGYSSGLVAALDTCEAAGANIINMSLGGSFKSRTEDAAFAAAETAGILSIAAAGNDGNSRYSYPASYNAVVSVAAVDANKQHAEFSQYNSQVELSGPGVGVLSSVPMGTALVAATTVANQDYLAIAMEGSPTGSASGTLMDCGTGESQCNAAGKVCLIQRGNISFADKVLACENGGGVAAIIYNNTAGMLNGTLGTTATAIPSIGVTAADGTAMLAAQGTLASVSIGPGNYAYFDGTSMATPHVAGVAALVWSQFPQCTNTQIRAILQVTAEDLDTAGRDNYTGFGLVQAKAAVDYLALHGCAVSNSGGNNGGGSTCKGKRCK